MPSNQILLDLETQRDFFLHHGPCSGEKSREAYHKILELFRWAKKDNIFVLSTVLRMKPGQTSPISPLPHCIEGTNGEKKARGTLMPRKIDLGMHNDTDIPADLTEKYQQVIFEKRSTDIFAYSKPERLLSESSHTTFIICGAGLAHGISQAAIGLRMRGASVILARDAITNIDTSAGKMARLRMAAKGVVFANTAQIIKPAHNHCTIPFRDDILVG